MDERRWQSTPVVVLLVLLGTTMALSAVDYPGPTIRDEYKRWLDDAEPLVTEAETETFASLGSDFQRERFIAEFWQRRGQHQAQRFHYNRLAALNARFRSREQERVVVLTGFPAKRATYPECSALLRKLEVWRYSPWQVENQSGRPSTLSVSLVFAQTVHGDPRSYRLWSPSDTSSPLSRSSRDHGESLRKAIQTGLEKGCIDKKEAGLLTESLENALGFDQIVEEFGWTRPEDLPADAAGPARFGIARLEVEYPGHFFDRTILHAEVGIPVDALATLDGQHLFESIKISGDIYREDRLADSFQVHHHVAGTPPTSGLVTLDLYRRLLPARYRLELRVEDSRGRVLLREDKDLEVPTRADEAVFPAGYSGDYNSLTQSDLVHLTTLPSIELLPAAGDLLTGTARLRAVTSGGPIAAVELYRDGDLVARDSDPPYVQEVDIPHQRHVFEAVALDPMDRALDRSEQIVRREGRPFQVTVELDGPVREGRQALSARMSVPQGETLAAVDFFLNDRHLVQRKSAPWRCSVPGPPYRAALFVRAVARLASGEEVEDLLFLTRLPAERVDVRLATLYVSVLGPNGQPVADLTAQELQVLEDGEKRSVKSADTVENLPLSVAVLLDASSSMGRRLLLAADSAQRFFEDTLEPRDRASLMVFSSDFRRLVGFTDDVQLLAQGAFGMRAFGTTRLHDAVVFAASSYHGQRDRRALVLLSDGADNGSDYPIEHVLDAALRARVMVFPIALADVGESTVSDLQSLADKTGGRFFRAGKATGLDLIYETIERVLRTQYHIVYEPSEDNDPDSLPVVEIDIDRPGLSVQIVRGE